MKDDTVRPEDVLRYWFGTQPEKSHSDPAFSKRWWSKDEPVDKDILARFLASTIAARNGAL